ncbi:MAG: DUF2911 domain-containing protein [Acidobacteria bacterium]|nr:DUF2911 domain-containing protein [Acidobacteriota bacterium]
MRNLPAWIIAALVASTVGVVAQARPDIKLPASPRGSAAIQVLGAYEKDRYVNGQWITVDYGRPILRGRQNIFGSGADYGKIANPDAPIWRAGANDSTQLATQASLTIGGTTLRPGVYNVLVDLKAAGWTLVMSTQPLQPKYNPNEKVLMYGAYNYDPKHDVLRVQMRMSTLDMSLEQLTIGFSDVRKDGGSFFIAWDKTMGAVEFTAK